tara:strand:- start:380 stop:544 length:165 start_codon:yes stop_codon:yes gene_type:complete
MDRWRRDHGIQTGKKAIELERAKLEDAMRIVAAGDLPQSKLTDEQHERLQNQSW